jgi:hypothetical protein
VTARKLTILFSGMIAADPWQGGATWAVLQYVLGLRRLGHDVYFIEPVPERSICPAGASLAGSDNATYFRAVRKEFLGERSALLSAGSRETVGLPYDALIGVARRADVLINVSGMLVEDELLRHVPLRVYLDLDPGFVQLWHATQGIDMRFDSHTHFATVGLGIGRADCGIPTCGRQWVTTLQPVVLEQWPVGDAVEFDGLTTVANWRGYGSVEHEGVHYGQKAHSLRKLLDLPSRTAEKFMLALNIHPGETDDLAALTKNGWRLLDPMLAATPRDYARFVRGSKAEFGPAKSGYVVSRCGWFSDRSACYLASGRPVVAQETGWAQFLPRDQGLFAFETAEDVVKSIDAINSDYPAHRAAARRIAEQYFDSDVVLPRLLQAVGAA